MKKALLFVVTLTAGLVSCKKEAVFVPIPTPDPTVTVERSRNYDDQVVITNDKLVLLAEWKLVVENGPITITPTVYFSAGVDNEYYNNVNFSRLKGVYITVSGAETTNKVTATQAPITFDPIIIYDDGVRTIRLYGTPGSSFYGFDLTSKIELAYQWIDETRDGMVNSSIRTTKLVEGQTITLH